jgi:hypothetical protein
MTMEVKHTMPFLTSGLRRCRLLAAATGLALLGVIPAAHAAGVAANPLGCTPQPALVQPFAAWTDTAEYTLSPGGDFENATSGWTLTNGARVVEGNEPFLVGAPDDRASLALATASSAISAPICIDDTYPWFRLFARNTGDLKSTLKVEVLYLDSKGKLKVRASGDYRAASADWAPTGSMKIDLAFDPTSVGGAAPVAFRFTPQGKGGNWQIDDVYVDPYRRF